jgi:hypothetical protein
MHEAKQTSDKVRWVEKRAACTISKVFQTLRGEVEKDVEERVCLFTDADRARRLSLEFGHHGFGRFSITRNGLTQPAAVYFRLDVQSGTISARDDSNKILLEATITMDDAGDCLLRITEAELSALVGTELTTWQFRRRALENFFFDPQVFRT